MKRWQIEQILYLNEFGKRKLAVPESQHLAVQTLQNPQNKREKTVVKSLRRLCNFFINAL